MRLHHKDLSLFEPLERRNVVVANSSWTNSWGKKRLENVEFCEEGFLLCAPGNLGFKIKKIKGGGN